MPAFLVIAFFPLTFLADGCICINKIPHRGIKGGIMECNCNTDTKLKHRNSVEKKDLITRLNRIEGQVRGLKNMIEEDRYCVDIVTQVSAVQAALNSFNKELLARHIKTCVSEDIKNGNEQSMEELCELLKKLMK